MTGSQAFGMWVVIVLAVVIYVGSLYLHPFRKCPGARAAGSTVERCSPTRTGRAAGAVATAGSPAWALGCSVRAWGAEGSEPHSRQVAGRGCR
jgi:hypothetical protein